MTEEIVKPPKIEVENAKALERQEFPAMLWLIKQYTKDGQCDGVLRQVDANGRPLEIEGEDGNKTKAVADDGKTPLPYFIQDSKTLKQRFGTSQDAIIWYIKNNREADEATVEKAGK